MKEISNKDILKKYLKTETFWTIVAIIVPVTIAIINYLKNPNQQSELLITIAIILASFSFLISRIRILRIILEKMNADLIEIDIASHELLEQVLNHPEMKSCRNIVLAYQKVLHYNNPLMIELANCQIQELADFLKKFNEGLPFFPESEIITIGKHYTSFMRKMGKKGSYIATTFPQFWYKEDDKTLSEFFSANLDAANNGVKIKRLFLIPAIDELDEEAIKILNKHAEISNNSYQNNGGIETKVYKTNLVNLNYDDFGIYFFNGEPKAIAIAQFYKNSNILQGNLVSFDERLMINRIQTFENRFSQAIDINKFLKTLKNN